MEKIKLTIFSICGAIGSFISFLLGGWTQTMTTLVAFMALDYLTGLIVAGVFKKSKKTKSGALESHVGYKGMVKKGIMLSMVYVAVRLDITLEVDFIKNYTIYGLIGIELISLVENWGLMGLPVPKALKNAIDKLVNREEEARNV